MSRYTDTTQTTAIGARLRQIRETHGQSRTEFGALLDVPPTTLKNYELGYRYPGAELLEVIAHKLGGTWALYALGAAPLPEQRTATQL